MINPFFLAYEPNKEAEENCFIVGNVDEVVAVVDDLVTNSGMSGEEFIGSGKTMSNDTTALIESRNDIVVPKVGMKFPNIEEVYEFYKSYAYREGFPIRTGSSKNGPDGKLRYYYLECSRSGSRESKSNDPSHPRPTGQTGCKAKISLVSEVLGV